MRYWDAVFAFLVALAVAATLTPVAGRLARLVGAIDFPKARGISQRATPRLGGLAIAAGVLVATLVWVPGTIHVRPPAHALKHSIVLVHTWTVMAGAGVILLVGAIDDWRELTAPIKLAGQVAAAVVAVHGGVSVTDVTLPFVGSFQFPNAGGALSVVWLVAIMNIINFSDGVDGLAAGLSAIDGIVFAVIVFATTGGATGAAELAAITAGAALGFLCFNFPPASIFMGDSGSNLLGYLLGVVGVIGALKTDAGVVLAAPLLVLAVPLVDTSFVVAKRLKYHRAPWTADDEHFHHRMKRIGFSPRKTLAYLYGWAALLAGVALALRLVPYSNHRGVHNLGWTIVMVAILVVALLASVYTVYVLEIVKFKALRSIQIRRTHPTRDPEQIEADVEHDVETGEFETVRR